MHITITKALKLNARRHPRSHDRSDETYDYGTWFLDDAAEAQFQRQDGRATRRRGLALAGANISHNYHFLMRLIITRLGLAKTLAQVLAPGTSRPNPEKMLFATVWSEGRLQGEGRPSRPTRERNRSQQYERI